MFRLSRWTESAARLALGTSPKRAEWINRGLWIRQLIVSLYLADGNGLRRFHCRNWSLYLHGRWWIKVFAVKFGQAFLKISWCIAPVHVTGTQFILCEIAVIQVSRMVCGICIDSIRKSPYKIRLFSETSRAARF